MYHNSIGGDITAAQTPQQHSQHQPYWSHHQISISIPNSSASAGINAAESSSSTGMNCGIISGNLSVFHSFLIEDSESNSPLKIGLGFKN